jgi:anthranilate synthase component I
MTGPWERFVAAADGREVVGYFETAPTARSRGSAAWFVARAELRPIARSSRVEELARTTQEFLARHPKGGVVGYVGFDAYGLFEPAIGSAPPGCPFPLGELAFVERLENGRPGGATRRPQGPRGRASPRTDSLPRARFERGVRRLVGEIRAGEAFQVVLSHRRSWPRPRDLLERAAELRASERYAYFYYLRFGDRETVGASPESVAEIRGSAAYVNPIAGTLPLGVRAGRRPLRRDPKELAEHRMLVDLARNDLGRVARPGSVHLVWRERRERYARLEHLVSRVGSTLRPGAGPWQVLRATFPAGTVSGAPKIRAVELLRREEGTWRGPYAGAVGCLQPRGRSDWALAIRGAFAAGRTLYTAAGAGIVHLSEPGREFDETLVKLGHVERTLAGAAG